MPSKVFTTAFRKSLTKRVQDVLLGSAHSDSIWPARRQTEQCAWRAEAAGAHRAVALAVVEREDLVDPGVDLRDAGVDLK